MKKVSMVILVLALVAAAVFSAAGQPRAAAGPNRIFQFGTMVGVPAGLTGSLAPIRGVNGGGIPWTLTSARGELKATGELDINVQGLVLAAGANTGLNPVAAFRGLVSCLTDTGGVVNILTDPFPATTGSVLQGGGNAKIHATLALPQPCIAPIVFVTSPTGSWFAVTGN